MRYCIGNINSIMSCLTISIIYKILLLMIIVSRTQQEKRTLSRNLGLIYTIVLNQLVS